jgi:hypothetical protein
MGLLPWSIAVHYAEGERRSAFHKNLLDGMAPGFAGEDGTALHFVGTELEEVVASRPAARAYRRERRGPLVVETRLATRYLGAAPARPFSAPTVAA